MAHNSESYTAHQYIFSAQSNNVIDPTGFIIKDPSYCDRYPTTIALLTPWGCDTVRGGTKTYVLNPNTGTGEREGRRAPFPCFGRGVPGCVRSTIHRWQTASMKKD